ncbi:hypothetical protein INR49_009884 [Caranx melampygus]|nr:hypothetical protein INR49_009884 [Caranx melampygus]
MSVKFHLAYMRASVSTRPGASSVSVALDTQGYGVKLISTSVLQTHVKIVGDVLMRLIDTTAHVLMASLGSTVRPTLMNACQHLVFTGAVWMGYSRTPACVNLDGLAADVKQTSTTVLPVPA